MFCRNIASRLCVHNSLGILGSDRWGLHREFSVSELITHDICGGRQETLGSNVAMKFLLSEALHLKSKFFRPSILKLKPFLYTGLATSHSLHYVVLACACTFSCTNFGHACTISCIFMEFSLTHVQHLGIPEQLPLWVSACCYGQLAHGCPWQHLSRVFPAYLHRCRPQIFGFVISLVPRTMSLCPGRGSLMWPHPHPQNEGLVVQSAYWLVEVAGSFEVDCCGCPNNWTNYSTSVHQTLFLRMRVWPHETRSLYKCIDSGTFRIRNTVGFSDFTHPKGCDETRMSCKDGLQMQGKGIGQRTAGTFRRLFRFQSPNILQSAVRVVMPAQSSSLHTDER